MDLKKLSLKEKIGQKFMFGVNNENIDVIIYLIKKYAIGGVILYKKNYNSYDDMLSVIKKLKEANKNNKIPLFIAIDQEGGRVNRMPSEVSNIKNVYNLSKCDSNLITKSAEITGEMLINSGINMNFAPVLDVCEDNNSKVLFNRCFYGDEIKVTNCGLNYVKTLTNSGVISVIKHFPGHGISKCDSHFITPYIYNYKKVMEKHMKPFEELINNKCDAIMVGHLIIRKITNGLPASISSKFIKEYLRSKFNGLIITDEINMLSRNPFYNFIYVKKALLNESDIILSRIKYNDYKVMDRYLKVIDKNYEYMNNLDDSVKRILKVKDKYKINDSINYDGCNLMEINKKIDKLNKLCL